MTIDSCTHEKCAIVFSNAFWEAHHFIGADGQAHLAAEATEANIVLEYETNPDLPRTTRKRRLDTLKGEKDKENMTPGQEKK